MSSRLVPESSIFIQDLGRSLENLSREIGNLLFLTSSIVESWTLETPWTISAKGQHQNVHYHREFVYEGMRLKTA